MASFTFIAYGLSLIIKKTQNFLLALRSLSAGWLLVTILAGCSLPSSNKLAALQVTSTPEASVFLDGNHLGKTPYFSDQLRGKEYLLKITTPDASFVDKVTLTPGTLTVVNRELATNFQAQSGENLWLVPSKQGLFISSLPEEADITIDGIYIGKTPIHIDKIEEGEHRVLLAKADFLSREFAIKTSKDYQLIADVTLASEIAKGNITSPSPEPIIKVEILKTTAGFLRVRKEPSATALEVGRVKTGDQLEVIQETADWVNVKFQDLPVQSGQSSDLRLRGLSDSRRSKTDETVKQGWISHQYTKKLP